MKQYQFGILLILIVIVSVMSLKPSTSTATKETAYERVVRTKTLRCGYILWPPHMARDPNTGKLSGYNYELVEAMGKSLGIKIDWATEVVLGTQVDVLMTNKADSICTCEGPITGQASLHLAYATPIIYFPFFAYARQNDERFDSDLSRINVEDVRISTVDGDISGEAASRLFPKAQQKPLPQLANPSQMMMDVKTNKADIIINDPMSIELFMKNNPKVLHKLSNEAITVIPLSLSTLRTETALTDMLSQAIKNIRHRGIEARIMDKYGLGTKIPLFRVKKDYVQP